MNFFKIDNLGIGKEGLFFILGPCVIEDEAFTLNLAQQLKTTADELSVPFIFKASFDKANRSSMQSFRGPGLQRG